MRAKLLILAAGASLTLQPAAFLLGWQSEAERQKEEKTVEIPDTKRELLRLIDDLKPKLPPELGRRLAVISMKIATGWCSPYLAEEFERDLNAQPESERRKFEAEWKKVRAHEVWPSLKRKEPSGQPTEKKPA